MANDASEAQRLLNMANCGDLESMRKFVNEQNVNTTIDDASLLTNAINCQTRTGPECVKFLLDCGADTKFRGPKQQIPLHLAAAAAADASLKLLLSADISVIDERDVDGNTPLMLAVTKMSQSTVLLLMDAGADSSLSNKEGQTAEDLAAKLRQWEIAALIKSMQEHRDAMTQAQRDSKQLCKYAQDGKLNKLDELVTTENVNCCYDGKSLLMHAILHPDPAVATQMAKLLLANGANTQLCTPANQQALHFAAVTGNAEIMSLLPHDIGAVNRRDADSCTPLMLAALQNSSEAVQLLIGWGAQLSMRHLTAGLTAEGLAAKAGHQELAELLRKHNEEARRICRIVERNKLQNLIDNITPDNVNLRYKDQTPLMYAIDLKDSKDSCKKVAALLERGADLNLVDSRGKSAIHYAAEADNTKALGQLLQKASAELINLQDYGGRTALMCAIVSNAVRAVELLLGAGCSVDLQNSDGLTAADLARKLNKKEALLRLKGGDHTTQKVDTPTAKAHNCKIL